MTYILLSLSVFVWLSYASPALSWDGFDADSTELMEVIPDLVPEPGQQIEVRNYETDKSVNGLVKIVTRNSRTIEIVYEDQDGKLHTLVMEGL